jgi:AbrB family looped-hinge helix DNA binding protein
LTIKEKKCRFLVLGVSEEKFEFTVYVRRCGRITVPKEVRDCLNIEEGNLVKCRIQKVKVS